MIVIMFVIGWLAARLYGGQTSDFILELPPMRMPQAGNVAIKTFARLEWYLKEVIPLFRAARNTGEAAGVSVQSASRTVSQEANKVLVQIRDLVFRYRPHGETIEPLAGESFSG